MNRDQTAFSNRLGLTLAVIQAHNYAAQKEARQRSFGQDRWDSGEDTFQRMSKRHEGERIVEGFRMLEL